MTPRTSREEIAARLKEARSRIFDTAADAARILHYKPVTVRAHESGQNGASSHQLEEYARLYGVDLLWLMTGQGDMTPNPQAQAQIGDLVQIFGTVEDGVWLPTSDEETMWPTRRTVDTPPEEDTIFHTDPRIPSLLVDAVRVATRLKDGPYLDGSIAFVAPIAPYGFRPGDHVVIIRTDTERWVCEWSLRRVDLRGDEQVFSPLISIGEPWPYGNPDDPMFTWIAGLVTSVYTRRPLPDWYPGSAASELRAEASFLKKHPFKGRRYKA